MQMSVPKQSVRLLGLGRTAQQDSATDDTDDTLVAFDPEEQDRATHGQINELISRTRVYSIHHPRLPKARMSTADSEDYDGMLRYDLIKYLPLFSHVLLRNLRCTSEFVCFVVQRCRTRMTPQHCCTPLQLIPL